MDDTPISREQVLSILQAGRNNHEFDNQFYWAVIDTLIAQIKELPTAQTCPHCAAGLERWRGEDDEGEAYWHVLEKLPNGGIKAFCACVGPKVPMPNDK